MSFYFHSLFEIGPNLSYQKKSETSFLSRVMAVSALN